MTELTTSTAGERLVVRGAREHNLKDVSLSIPSGSVRAVAGPNGAGKSTLFALILGFLHPTAGSIRISGQEPRGYLNQRGAAYLPERFQLPGEWRVQQALVALGRLERLDARAARTAADRVLAQFQLDPYADRSLKTLSRGLLQRVGLAQALLTEHELVVLDEPTEGLDPVWRIRFRTVMNELRQAGRTVLMASHDLAEIEQLADQVILMEGGRVTDMLDPLAESRGPTIYEIELASPSPAMAEAFPDATESTEEGGPAEGEGRAATYRVTVTDANELSSRLAALLAAGGTLVAVRPVMERLEARVQRALGAGDSAG
jgi:ABC-2 type transport system ATP-binding protein